MAQHEATPALIPIWIPCWGSRAHRGGNTEAVCMSGGIIQWDSTAREGTHLNQPQVVVGEHRRAEPQPQPLGREGNPSCTGWPHWQRQRKNFQLQKNHWISQCCWAGRSLFIQGQLSLLRKGSSVVQNCLSLACWWVCVFIQGCQPCSREERFAEKQGFNITLRSSLLKLWDTDWNLAWSKTDCISSPKCSD